MGIRVMIVDDAGFIRQLLSRLLQGSDCEIVAEARNGTEAVDLAQKFKPAVIFMDIVLPGKNGVQASAEILEFLPGTSIVAMSTASEAPVVTRAIEVGCIAFLEKPFSRDSVQKVLEKLGISTGKVKHG